MRFSLDLPTQRVTEPGEFVTIEAIAEVTRAAAAAGFDAVNVTDHPAPDSRWLDGGGHHALDPFVALAVVAGTDSTIKLHTNIYVAAYRNPFIGAKSVHSLDVLSGGRVVLGVAAGYLKPEFAAVGVDFERRGALLDDALEVLDQVCRGDDVARTGDGYAARGVRFRPETASGRRPPVWVGGNSRAAMRRAVRYDGWAPFHTAGYARSSRTVGIEDLDDLRAAISSLRELRAESDDAGAGTFDICWSEALISRREASAGQRRSRVAELEAAGVTWLTVDLPGDTRAEFLDRVAAYGRDVLGADARSAR